MKKLPLASGLFALLVFVSSAAYGKPAPYTRTRIGLVPKDPAAMTVTKDQVSFTASVIDGTNYHDDPKTFYHETFVGKNGGQVGFDDLACQEPFFRVVVENGSDQTLKLRSSASGSSDEVVVAVDDDLGNTYTAQRKAEILADLPTSTARTAQNLAADPAAAIADMTPKVQALYSGLQFLTDDTTILPGRKSSFYACFVYVPGAADDQEQNKLFQKLKELTLGFYDVPVQRDAAGTVTKKTSYQISFTISEWLDHYEYDKNHPVLVSSDKVR